ncbi:tryptophan--tRNA ligase, mitochondrial [Diabrotica virgifera virgifera]|uniref:tryptophan--tRNA ligase n=1 Tax=Diabrotica virgifera virgifera TaxID=50390 RepID=A0ABM5IG69_DIAVI|nr:tryptophan--tRNA ligase, mitochondrial [Diabrotica virgifera virgifera]
MFARNKLFPKFSKRLFCSKSIKTETKYQKRIFSGIQPTGAIHLGNYLGAIAQWVKLQDQGEHVILAIADLHSMTLPHEPKILSRNIQEIAATLLACGIDPNRTILFQQSKVAVHTQLSWCLGCICTMPRLAHLPQYKEKSKDLKDIPLGLFVYPVLQAADILAYKATHVPVGEDQIQQIQLSQDLARMFNKKFGETFPIPHALTTGSEYARLRSLRDPSKKMSKSDPDPKSRICLTDRPDDIVRNIKKAVTDFNSEVTYDPEGRPGIANLINIHSFATNKSVEDICKDAKNINTGEYKLVVADAVVNFVTPIQERISGYLSEPQLLLEILEQGREKADDIASKNWDEVQYKLGLNFKAKAAKKVKVCE